MPKGKQIMSLADLERARFSKRSVVADWIGLKTPRPAAFIMQWSGELILRLLRSGLYIYEKEKRNGAVGT